MTLRDGRSGPIAEAEPLLVGAYPKLTEVDAAAFYLDIARNTLVELYTALDRPAEADRYRTVIAGQ